MIQTYELRIKETSNVQEIIKKNILKSKGSQWDKTIGRKFFVSLFLLKEIVTHIFLSFLEDFDVYSLSRICSTINQIIRSQSFHLFLEKEEENIP